MIIGRERDKEILVSRLVSGSSHEGDGGLVHVVAVVGIGGLGKTTLAQQIYHDEQVRAHFDKFLWVCVSDVFEVTRLTKAIIEQAKGTSTSLSELDSLQNELLQELRRKHFFLVLDDVWNDDEEEWKKLRLPLNSGAQGSRILVTTRSEKVANTMRAIDIHELEGLSDDHAWTLFHSRAFVGRNVEEYPELESVGREIVNKCKGVPLAIKVIGNAMNSKETVEDWKSVLNSKTWSPVTSKILPALLLTYYNLPTHLKQCFVYCSMFPKDWPLEKDTLVRLWVAQGLIPWEGSREIEDVGAEYFDELLAWSILQQRMDTFVRIKRYTVHDLLHDLGEFIAKDEIYRFVSTGEGGKSDVRHAFLSFTGTDDTSNNMPIGAKKLWTVYLRGVNDGSHKVMVADLLQQSRFLRAVVFENSGINSLPDGIGNMKHLRYLDLSRSNIVELPESVSHLRKMRTLNLNDCDKLKKLPRGIGRMVSLRHLEIEGTDALKYLPKGLGRISGLRSLCKFIVEGGGEGVEGCRIDELQSLNSLHGSLRIEHLEKVSSREEAEKAQLWNKPDLSRLVLKMSGGRYNYDDAETERTNNVIEGLRPHVNLEELELHWYRRSRMPSWMDEMQRLCKLELINCPKMERVPHLPSLKEFTIHSLRNEILPDGGGWERLVALQKLEIRCCSRLKCLIEELGQLKKLKSLVIDVLPMLRCLPDSLGQLESLEHLHIFSCQKLQSLPDSLGDLKALNRLEISDCQSLGSLPNGLEQLKSLNRLEIRRCNALSSLPDGLQHLSLLQHLRIIDCQLLSERCKRDGGEDWPKISHIPDVYVN